MVRLMRNEKGFTLIEVIIALALLGIIAAAFLSGLATASKALFIADERTTAESLARSQMEYGKSQDYASEYTPAPIPDEYAGYSATIDVEPLPDPNNPGNDLVGIQKIIVKIYHGEVVIGEEVITLEGYKVDR